MIFESIFKGSLTLPTFIICLVAAIALGIINALVFLYKTKHSASFALALALLPMAVAVVIMMVNGNIGTGVAVAGAFALVRFRSVPGTAREIAAIFVDMAIGLALGMGYIAVALLFTIFAAIVTLALTAIGFGDSHNFRKQMKITIPENLNYEGLFDDIFAKYDVQASLDKIRTTNMGTLFELTYQVAFAGDTVPKEFMDDLRTRNGNLTIIIGERPNEVETL